MLDRDPEVVREQARAARERFRAGLDRMHVLPLGHAVVLLDEVCDPPLAHAPPTQEEGVNIPKNSLRSALKFVMSPSALTNVSTSQFAFGPCQRVQVWPARVMSD